MKHYLITIFLSFALVVSLIGTGTAPRASADAQTGGELELVRELGFLTDEQAKRVTKGINQVETVQMIARVIEKSFGKTGNFLADREKAASAEKIATRHYFSSTLYFAAYEQIKKPAYENYTSFMDTASNGYDDAMSPDAVVVLEKQNGKIAEGSVYEDCTDRSDINGNPTVASISKYVFLEDFGCEASAQYLCTLYDRVSGLPVMTLNDKNEFRPQEEMTAGAAARAVLRYYRSLEPAANYVPVPEAGTYNKDIITDELLNKKSSLPDASNQKLPVWHGVLDTRMAYVIRTALNARPDKVFREGDIKAYADTGFNHLSVYTSFSRLQGDQFKKNYVNKSG